MYIIVFSDGLIGKIKKLTKNELTACHDGYIDIIDPKEMKILDSVDVSSGELIWKDIQRWGG